MSYPAFTIRYKNRDVTVKTEKPLDKKKIKALSKELLEHMQRVEADPVYDEPRPYARYSRRPK
jgi:hypothetical protein